MKPDGMDSRTRRSIGLGAALIAAFAGGCASAPLPRWMSSSAPSAVPAAAPSSRATSPAASTGSAAAVPSSNGLSASSPAGSTVVAEHLHFGVSQNSPTPPSAVPPLAPPADTLSTLQASHWAPPTVPSPAPNGPNHAASLPGLDAPAPPPVFIPEIAVPEAATDLSQAPSPFPSEIHPVQHLRAARPEPTTALEKRLGDQAQQITGLTDAIRGQQTQMEQQNLQLKKVLEDLQQRQQRQDQAIEDILSLMDQMIQKLASPKPEPAAARPMAPAPAAVPVPAAAPQSAPAPAETFTPPRAMTPAPEPASFPPPAGSQP
ncbi:hypothetical protein VT03_26955 [Planctomyces sp. SH-PL14]|nr:hypothetical protein VT03_26955 [Planctomyces sp. SH-PL14]